MKTLIGSELITDNYVAIFELVKNSFDAGATEVVLRFENIYTKNGKIIIQDNGKGMDHDDLVNKWLFVAYSAKKDGTEDFSDYREHRIYAGSKGVGRFSCDRLGRYLNLITKKQADNAKVENLKIDWREFDKDQKEEFDTIPVQHNELDPSKFPCEHGTILEISGLPEDEWNRTTLIRLKDRLSKLIRPDLHTSIKDRKFSIELVVNEEEQNDKEEKKKAEKKKKNEGYIYRNTVNGQIQNFVFEELDIRTTKIFSSISNDGNFLTTRMDDRNSFLYEIKEENPFELLEGISITLYFLNRSAKSIFKRRMGVDTVKYGNIFVYKNGFRVYPFGERGDDTLGIDNRAVQGYARYIGLRNLIGLINISGPSKELRETTSRAGGLVKTKTYHQLANLENGFLVNTLRKLEKYVVEVTRWGINKDEFEVENDTESRERLVKLISNISDDQKVVNIQFNDGILDILETKEEESALKLVKNYKRIAAQSNDSASIKDAEKLEKRIKQQTKALSSATRELEVKAKQLEEQESETLFARAVLGVESKELLSVQHHIHRHAAQHIISHIDKLVDLINEGAASAKLLKIVDKISLENQKIITLTRFVTKARFDTKTNKISADLVKFVTEYVLNVYREYKFLAVNNQKIDITVDGADFEFPFRFKPIEVIIILDNLLNNSFKAEARYVNLTWEKINDNRTQLRVTDDGIGIPLANEKKIFDFRFSTTDGSGLGLYHVREVITKMGGNIAVVSGKKSGTEFLLTFTK